jgi:signal transduction histidine kinase
MKEAGLPVELRVEGQRPVMAPGVEVAAYRIVQEALTNALKYAGGARTEVVVTYAPDALTLVVLDDGQADVPPKARGRGLLGMRERVAVYGGSFEAGKRPGGGYAVRARLPLEAPA